MFINAGAEEGGGGTRWCIRLRNCAASRKDTGSIPDGVIRIFLLK